MCINMSKMISQDGLVISNESQRNPRPSTQSPDPGAGHSVREEEEEEVHCPGNPYEPPAILQGKLMKSAVQIFPAGNWRAVSLCKGIILLSKDHRARLPPRNRFAAIVLTMPSVSARNCDLHATRSAMPCCARKVCCALCSA